MPLTNLSTVLKSGLVKNYITLGDFESGSTLGWSLLHSALTNLVPTSVGSAGAPFSLTSGATAAAATLSFSAISSNVLAGTRSGSLVSSAASTAGDMLITDAYTIDQEDQNKVLTFRFYYNNVGSNLTFAGNSTNSFAVYIYDVDNGTWIQPAGVYNLIQGVGTGYCIGTFQTANNATRIQLAVVNINASAGAYSLTVDDFSIGPMAAVQGVPATDWVDAGPTIITAITTAPTKGTATLAIDKMRWRRIGDSMHVRMEYRQTAAGTATAGTGDYLFQIPTGFSIDTNKISITGGATIGSNVVVPANSGIGSASWTGAAGVQIGAGWVAVFDSTRVRLVGMLTQVAGNNSSMQTANSASSPLTFATQQFLIDFIVPISGWSANVQMSTDTDTRVCAARVHTTVARAVANNTTVPLQLDVTDFDTHGAISTVATITRFTAPISGYYQVSAAIGLSQASQSQDGFMEVIIRVNGSTYSYTKHFGVNAGTDNLGGGGAEVLKLNVGDFVELAAFQNTGPSRNTTNDNSTYLAITRVGGPATVAASESVNARYFASATSITGALATINWTTKDFDSHAGMVSGTYTIPVSGKYQISALLTLTAASAAAGNAVNIQIQKNGTVVSEYAPVYQSTQVTLPIEVEDEISCLAGDTIRIQASSAATTPSIVASNSKNYFSIARTGN